MEWPNGLPQVSTNGLMKPQSCWHAKSYIISHQVYKNILSAQSKKDTALIPTFQNIKTVPALDIGTTIVK